MINLLLARFSSGEEDTLGVLYLNGEFFCFTLEDEYRKDKIPGETRIAEGVYDIDYMPHVTPKTISYRNRYPWFDKHIHIKDVPNFTGIYIHIGNDDDDTAGCILVGDTVQGNKNKEGYVSNSTSTFKELYGILSEALDNNVPVQIKIIEL